jgi:hypothetical protein
MGKQGERKCEEHDSSQARLCHVWLQYYSWLIVMQAMSETLIPLWQQAKIVTPELRFDKESKSCYGKMKEQNTTTK